MVTDGDGPLSQSMMAMANITHFYSKNHSYITVMLLDPWVSPKMCALAEPQHRRMRRAFGWVGPDEFPNLVTVS